MEIISVIDIGSSAIRMVVAQVDKENAHWSILNHAERPVSLGKDVFESGKIPRKTLIQVLQILKGYQEMMKPYEVDHIQAIATSALREAKNRETFVDRVLMRTGINIVTVDGVEANRLTYLAVRHNLNKYFPRLSKSNAVIMEVGGGSTEVMLLHRGNMVAAHNLSLGTIRIEQEFPTITGSQLSQFLREKVRGTIDVFRNEMRLKGISKFIAVGGDARRAVKLFGERINKGYGVVDREKFIKEVKKLETKTLDEIVSDLHISYVDAEPLLPALLIYGLFLEATSADRMIVPEVSIREGILVDYVEGESAPYRNEFEHQVEASVKVLAKKCYADEDHAEHVKKLALLLFDAMQTDHGLNRRCRMLLGIAAYLHDIGTFVNASGHHKHGEYIIRNSEIFGLSSDDINIVSNVVRYHRKALPQKSHMNYVALSNEDRLIVLKLAAILRIADAMDRHHAHLIKTFSVEHDDDAIIIHTKTDTDLVLEQISVENRSNLFEEVYGLKVILK